MKSLFKKGDKSNKDAKDAQKPKKPLFGKKPAAKSADSDETTPPKAKKAGFSLAKKPTSSSSASSANAPKPKKPLFGKKAKTPASEEGDAPPSKKPVGKSAKKPKSGGAGLNSSKLIIIIGGLLALVLFAVVAKMFLFKSEPAPAPVVPSMPAQPVTPPPAPVPAPVEVAPPSEGAVVTPATPEPVAPAVAEQPAPAPVVANESQTMSVAPIAPPAPQGTTDASGKRTFTREEFLQESKNRVYRERDTSQ